MAKGRISNSLKMVIVIVVLIIFVIAVANEPAGSKVDLTKLVTQIITLVVLFFGIKAVAKAWSKRREKDKPQKREVEI